MEGYGIIFSYIGILFIFYFSRYLILKRNWILSNKNTWVLLSIHLFAFALFITCIILLYYHIAFRGYNSTSIIYILMVGTGIPFYLFRDKTFLPGFLNILLSFLCAITVPVFVLCSFITITDNKKNIWYEDDTYRIEKTGGFMYEPFGALYVKKGIMERKYWINRDPIEKEQISSIKIEKPDSLSVLIRVDHKDTFYTSPLLIEIPVKK